MKISIITATIFLFQCMIQPSSLHAQGALTPPGPPAPTMKTADQIYAKLESRIPISTNTTPGDATDSFIISQPGSYYLTTNLTDDGSVFGIEILTNNVTLDLNGFAVQAAPRSPGFESGIFLPNACTNVTVRNGMISGWNRDGVESLSEFSANITLEQLSVSANDDYGLYLLGPGVLRNCNCQSNGDGGIVCYGGIVSGCVVNNNGGTGISATTTGTLDCEVIGNICFGNEYGIEVFNANTRVENNHVAASGYAGIWIQNSPGSIQNIVIKNSVSGSQTINYQVPPGNVFGPIVNDSSGNITNSSPWGNFSF